MKRVKTHQFSPFGHAIFCNVLNGNLQMVNKTLANAELMYRYTFFTYNVAKLIAKISRGTIRAN